jgi:hypothetical protein
VASHLTTEGRPNQVATVDEQTVSALATASGIRPPTRNLRDLAASLQVLLDAIERCRSLDLQAYEPRLLFRPDTGEGRRAQLRDN